MLRSGATGDLDVDDHEENGDQQERGALSDEKDASDVLDFDIGQQRQDDADDEPYPIPLNRDSLKGEEGRAKGADERRFTGSEGRIDRSQRPSSQEPRPLARW